MKISKNQNNTSNTSTNASARVQARQHIRAAIDVLTPAAADDETARDSIANLSVVLLDLQ